MLQNRIVMFFGELLRNLEKMVAHPLVQLDVLTKLLYMNQQIFYRHSRDTLSTLALQSKMNLLIKNIFYMLMSKSCHTTI